MTRIDRLVQNIRIMSDEELKEWIVACVSCPFPGRICGNYDTCDVCWLKDENDGEGVK